MKYNIKIFSDFTCPFCYLGKGIVRELKKNFIIEDEWLGFEVNPGIPEDGIPLSQYFKGLDTKDVLTPLKKRAKQFGLPFHDVEYLYDTSLALKAAEYAKEQHKYDEFSLEVFKAYFSDGLNISKEEVLKEIAEKAGLDSTEMLIKIETDEYQRKIDENQNKASIHNVQSVPTFIINDEYKLTGAQPLEVFEGLLLEIYNNKAFNKKD
ncbi:DsbA family oxidoreductase [Clostridium polynesiense]|uniref:DsbA family oxidoreductase n=1 Tax=Clostridium polynesiense TaxID=1325933 RepID=UPI00058AD3A5|nr:DsbA family oxidoreductase [Clostridium polynesiense]